MLIVRLVTLGLLVGSVFILNGFQLGSLVIKPFAPAAYRAFNAHCAGAWWSFLVYCLENIFYIRLIYDVEEVGGRNLDPPVKLATKAPSVLLVCNHQSLLDALVILIFAKRHRALASLKWFVKDSLRYIPLLGWGLWFLDCVFLKRNWNVDAESIRESFEKFRRQETPIWLVSFVEGTRRSEKSVSKSRDYAIRHGLEPFRNLLMPKYKGFTATLEGMAGRLDFVYDLTLRYAPPQPTFWALLNGKIGPIRVLFRKFEVASIPVEPLQTRAWLLARFREKDEWLCSGCFRRGL
jgi:1-acyl-sn-glycerol-3-phosphate acyltransferase